MQHSVVSASVNAIWAWPGWARCVSSTLVKFSSFHHPLTSSDLGLTSIKSNFGFWEGYPSSKSTLAAGFVGHSLLPYSPDNTFSIPSLEQLPY